MAGPHGPLARFLAWHVDRHRFGPGDRVSLLSGLGHDPLLRDLLTPLLCGATLEVPDPVEWWTPGWLASWMGERRITACHMTPAMTRLLAVRGRRGEGGPGSLAALGWAFFGGEPLTGKDVERLRSLAPAARMVNLYGATETPQGMGWYPLEDGKVEADPLPLGRGIEGVQLLLLDRRGETAGVGEVGEIAVRTPYLSRGYLGDPRTTARRFAPADSGGRLYRTGDLGRYRLDGGVEYLGRRDRQVKVRGFRVEPAEVERVLTGLPGVAAAAVAARPAGGGAGADAAELRLLAWVVPDEGRELAAPAVLEALRRRLPEVLVPAAVVPVAALPLTSRGKVDHRALPDPEAAPGRRVGPVEAPRSALERTIAAVFRQVLKVEEVGRHDRFFDLGGHSLHLVEVRARLEEELDRELPLPELFNHPTVASLAAYLGEAAAGGQALQEVAERASELAAGKARRLERRGRRASLLEGLDDG